MIEEAVRERRETKGCSRGENGEHIKRYRRQGGKRTIRTRRQRGREGDEEERG